VETIKVISLGDPDKGFTNYFMHGDCFDEVYQDMLLRNESLIEALRLNEWGDYQGTQFTGRFCVWCSKVLREEAA